MCVTELVYIQHVTILAMLGFDDFKSLFPPKWFHEASNFISSRPQDQSFIHTQVVIRTG